MGEENLGPPENKAGDDPGMEGEAALGLPGLQAVGVRRCSAGELGR